MDILEVLKQLRDDLKTWVTINLKALNDKIDAKTVPIDDTLNENSTNPVQNKAIVNAINNIPRFSGDYNDLVNAPNITEDDTDNIIIIDDNGNVIFKVDAEGTHTTASTLNGENVATESYVNKAIAAIPGADLTNHYTKNEVNDAIDNLKEDMSESIDSDSDEWKIIDSLGNVILDINKDGAHTAALTINDKPVATEEYVGVKIAELVDSAPKTLDTLGELATAMKENADVVETLDKAIGNKANVTHSHNDLYYTEVEVNELINDVNTSITNHTHNFNDLEDKPFYETVNELYNNQDFWTVAEDGWRFKAHPGLDFVLEDRKQYKVVYGDNTYIYTAKVGTSGDVFIGNGFCPYRRNGDDNGEPVYLFNYSGSDVHFYTKDYATSLAIYEYDFKYLEPKYIKDMYYETEPVETIIVDNLSAEDYNNGNYNGCTFIVGQAYDIIWNGELYKDIICVEDGGYRCLKDDNDRFSIDDDGGNGLYISTDDEVYTLSIIANISTINKIDKKYLPDDLVGKSTTGIEYQLYDKDYNEYTVIAAAGAEIFNDYINNAASGEYSHAEGTYTTASGDFSHAEGRSTKAYGLESHAEGEGTIASGTYSHAEGYEASAFGFASHSEGAHTQASGEYSHAEGYNSKASGQYSHVEGFKTIASSSYQHAQGKNNIEDTENKYVHIVGNGESPFDRANAHTLDWDGNAWYQGDIYVGGTSQDEGSKKLVTEEYVNEKLGDIEALLASI